ncbi:uncharacterized protein [Littorina saxatilis]|uniref:uncharacterized protein n=1 Tax=Littorina saxatilis TaxID=31220 RepID=UPI0038B5F443
MVADPHRVNIRLSMSASLNLRIEGGYTNFTAYGKDNIIGGLTVAIPLKRSDVIHAHAAGHFVSDNEALLGVVLVSHDKSNFRTLRGIPNSLMENHNSEVYFYQTLLSSGMWARNLGHRNWITPPSDGMYWVSARPEAASQTMTITLKERHGSAMRVLFRVFLQRPHIAVSASGAFELSTAKPIGMVCQNGFSEARILRTGTMLSFVKLIRNTGHAYTALTSSYRRLGPRIRLRFRDPITDKGNMYQTRFSNWVIRRSGVYIVSIRGDPDGATGYLGLLLYVNGNIIFRATSERGVPSGQDAVFKFRERDKLSVVSNDGDFQTLSFVDVATMFSIAFVALA